MIHIRWIAPQPRETMTGYARRLVAQIEDTENVILIGVSFGGMIAQEITQFMRVAHLIIISSVISHKEMSLLMKWGGQSQLHRLVPAKWLRSLNLLLGAVIFGVNKEPYKKLLTDIIRDTDLDFMKWAMTVIPRWKGGYALSSYTRIHGASDYIFPAKKTKDAILVEKEGIS